MHRSNSFLLGLLTLLFVIVPGNSLAHDPIFGLGPHTLFKGGVEYHASTFQTEAGDRKNARYLLRLKYGLTSNWTIGIATPYVFQQGVGPDREGLGATNIATKYRFWRKDGLGLQESASLSLTAILDNGANEVSSGATDYVTGLTYGYEGRKWYRWAAMRYRNNGTNGLGLDRGDKVLVDLVGGIRFKQTGYLEPDWVWMIELNGESSERDSLNGLALANSGGVEWFASPGLMWTYRNFAIKTGVQIPISSDLNGTQNNTDYRAILELELHR